ncbi:hypothetical protein CEXT_409851 [Caerostris extrusa]|uniref:Uncharacterized protein n=1 Tax=Caerostris extrusa TaxID=172846 RepID=A0AAV4XJ39_CAEEX|nr:hypothetical protein CEXT_409851 [Caerostris extrusa]
MAEKENRENRIVRTTGKKEKQETCGIKCRRGGVLDPILLTTNKTNGPVTTTDVIAGRRRSNCVCPLNASNVRNRCCPLSLFSSPPPDFRRDLSAAFSTASPIGWHPTTSLWQ